jgi:hypothetical protein
VIELYGLRVKWWRHLRDWLTTERTRQAIGDRECRHNGSEPKCSDCLSGDLAW